MTFFKMFNIRTGSIQPRSSQLSRRPDPDNINDKHKQKEDNVVVFGGDSWNFKPKISHFGELQVQVPPLIAIEDNSSAAVREMLAVKINNHAQKDEIMEQDDPSSLSSPTRQMNLSNSLSPNSYEISPHIFFNRSSRQQEFIKTVCTPKLHKSFPRLHFNLIPTSLSNEKTTNSSNDSDEFMLTRMGTTFGQTEEIDAANPINLSKISLASEKEKTMPIDRTGGPFEANLLTALNSKVFNENDEIKNENDDNHEKDGAEKSVVGLQEVFVEVEGGSETTSPSSSNNDCSRMEPCPSPSTEITSLHREKGDKCELERSAEVCLTPVSMLKQQKHALIDISKPHNTIQNNGALYWSSSPTG